VSEEDCASALRELLHGAEALGIYPTALQQAQLIRYCYSLRAALATANLTGVRSPSGIMRTLFLDSLTIHLALPERFRSPDGERMRVVDIGSGAGIPGVPLKIAYPHWQLTLVESVGKKARFLETIGRTAGLEGIAVVPERAEVLGHKPGFRDAYDLCLARAVSSLPSLVELCAPFARVDGLLAFPKGSTARTEINEAKEAARRLLVELVEIAQVPQNLGLGDNRYIVMYRKTGKTPPRYPRRVGLAQSRPL